jgi:sensor c-di-GMP phosphodiesterase-like protein
MLLWSLWLQAIRVEQERQKHEADASKMAKKQAKLQDEAARRQEDAEKVRRATCCSIDFYHSSSVHFESIVVD